MENLTREESEKFTVSGVVEGFYTYKLNGVEIAICPFDRSHNMLAKRLQYHLRKCVKQHLGQKVPCPYNVTEFVNAEDIERHLINCPSRTRTLVQTWNSKMNWEKKPNTFSSPPIDKSVPYDVEEYW